MEIKSWQQRGHQTDKQENRKLSITEVKSNKFIFHLVFKIFKISLSFPQVEEWLMAWHRCSSSATSVSAGFIFQLIQHFNLQAGEMLTSAR